MTINAGIIINYYTINTSAINFLSITVKQLPYIQFSCVISQALTILLASYLFFTVSTIFGRLKFQFRRWNDVIIVSTRIIIT